MTGATSGGPPTDRLIRALAAAAVPEQLRHSLAATPPDPERGQLWRARRGDTSVLVLLTGVQPSVVDVVPVTMDDDYNADDSIVLAADSSPLQIPLTVWPELANSMPMRVLDRCVGDLQLPGAASDPISAAAAAGRYGKHASSPADPVLEYRSRTADSLTYLAETSTPGSGELPQILAAADLPAAALAQLAGIGLPDVLALRRGQRPLGPAEAARLAPALQISAEELMAANPAPPTSLIAAASRPRRRPQVLALARATATSEDAAFTRTVFETFALAARSSGATDTPTAWDARLDRYFQMVLDE